MRMKRKNRKVDGISVYFVVLLLMVAKGDGRGRRKGHVCGNQC